VKSFVNTFNDLLFNSLIKNTVHNATCKTTGVQSRRIILALPNSTFSLSLCVCVLRFHAESMIAPTHSVRLLQSITFNESSSAHSTLINPTVVQVLKKCNNRKRRTGAEKSKIDHICLPEETSR